MVQLKYEDGAIIIYLYAGAHSRLLKKICGDIIGKVDVVSITLCFSYGLSSCER